MIWRKQFISAMFPKFLINNDNVKYIKDASLDRFSTFRIGGKAKHLFIVRDNINLLMVCYLSRLHNLKYKVIGLGANLLFDDDGYNGVIVVNKSDNIMSRDNHVFASRGASMGKLINRCKLRNLSGLENLSGIPSTVGGAVVNNLGAFDCSIADCIEQVECYKKSNLSKRIILKKDDCRFQYRDSIFKHKDYIITRVKFKLNYDNADEINNRITDIINKKSSSQPLNQHSAGSVFKRGKIIPAKVIDELRLKGEHIGGAMVSTKHAGFIVNTGNATSKDVLNLISKIKSQVKISYDEDLEEEIEFVHR